MYKCLLNDQMTLSRRFQNFFKIQNLHDMILDHKFQLMLE